MFSANTVRHLARAVARNGGKTALRGAALSTARFAPSVLASSSSIPTNFCAQQQVAYKSTQAVDFDHTGRDAYDVSRTVEGTDACLKTGLDKLGITNPSTLYRNMTYQQLYEHEQKNGEGVVAHAEYGDTFVVDTGKYTGRSPKDRWIVLNPGSKSAENIDWNNINMPTSPEVFDELYDKAVAHFNTKEKAYVFDGYCGARKDSSRLKVRFVHEMAWQQHFVSNMFIRPEEESELDGFDPDFTVINCCSQVDEDWERHGLNSETAVVFNIEKKTAVIFGTWYGGENKKGIFSLMNYLLPMAEKPMFPMHCSANVGKDGDVALFFGLSGTGKTTLSADPHRALIGDDEHGWDDKGVFNFEGGCYAKTIDLTEKTEPDIYRAIHTDALLENVKILDDGTPDYFDTTKTENGRVSYPIFHIPNYHKEQVAGHPNNVIFLSCDAFGVLPPVARLSSGQAMYHFLSGYTAKVAGTERGITEPVATFSTCFGAAFMTLHPTVYADLLKEKMETYGSQVFLVNSGWAGGPYGEGSRMSIKATRSCIDAIMNGSINDAEFAPDPIFGFDVPKALEGVDPALLDIKSTWAHPEKYDETAQKLASMYVENFKKYEGKGSVDYTQYGPQL
ncbi:Phosphoenolpyruvate carboxykinase (ATP) [Seminavis robusta]|uniref:phosphoenolpyruvate carboxykinase (ATP) n=1 Tax=Seminavis robusta TaxID=568900 RepID=A0A9N8EW97_9STRA|nr:Phosphoenolpyruvate carboxykinase (ATP) [Seminavis robusta]|eukprot:Sro2106_g314810.1 Phosphoenolpyruvate carboxykinase (ATP) (619) ;mRNA; r:10419-12696